jgi:predicted GTPase
MDLILLQEYQMETQIQNQNLETTEKIDLEELEQLLLKSEASIREAADKDIVLVVGKTGCGKSTLINYLHDGDMCELRDITTGDLRIYNKNAGSDHTRFPTIGHGLSETSYPRAYLYKDKYPFALCDTAGFGDTRGQLQDLCAYFSLSIAVRAAKRAKAVIIAVDEGALEVDRGQPWLSRNCRETG